MHTPLFSNQVPSTQPSPSTPNTRITRAIRTLAAGTALTALQAIACGPTAEGMDNNATENCLAAETEHPVSITDVTYFNYYAFKHPDTGKSSMVISLGCDIQGLTDQLLASCNDSNGGLRITVFGHLTNQKNDKIILGQQGFSKNGHQDLQWPITNPNYAIADLSYDMEIAITDSKGKKVYYTKPVKITQVTSPAKDPSFEGDLP